MSFLATKKASPQSAMVWPTYTGLQLADILELHAHTADVGHDEAGGEIFLLRQFPVASGLFSGTTTGKGGKGGGWGLQLTGWTTAPI